MLADPGRGAPLALALEQEGFRVHRSTSAEQARRLVTRTTPDLVLLDLGLPGVPGPQACGRLRWQWEVPVVLLSASGGSADVVAGLRAGADDVVTGPLVPDELVARVLALLRRVSRPVCTRLGRIELAAQQGLARRDGVDLHLTKTEFRLLCELAADPGRLVTRAQLLTRVWGCSYVGDTRLLDVHVRRLRLKVEDDPSDPRLVLTVRGLGHRLQV